MAASSPSYDMVLQILERVKDLPTLFRCATACKGWRRLLVDDPSFLRRCLPEDVCRRSAPFPGFFAQLRPRRGAPTPCLVPAPRPVLGSYRRPLRSFIPNLDDDHAVPLVSRHGLLLVRLALAGVDPNLTRNVLLAVCNLLTGTLDVLPRLEHDCAVHDHDMTGYAILTDADYSSSIEDRDRHRLPSFKVLVVGISGSTMKYRVRTFTAGEPRWNMCSGIVEGGRFEKEFMQHNAVVCGGIARWLFHGESTFSRYWGWSATFYTLDVSAESGGVSFTKLTGHQLTHGLNYEESYFSVDPEGRLALIYLQREGLQLKIWTWDDGDNGRLPDARVLMLQHPCQHKKKKKKKKEIGVVYTCIGHNNGTLLIKDSHWRVYVADIKTGVKREVTDNWPRKCDLRRSKTVALEMDWPTLFLSRLGVGPLHSV